MLDVLSIGALGLPGRMRLVPQFIALIAELALTEALHVRASDLLLDGLPALRTFPRVLLDPGGIGLL